MDNDLENIRKRVAAFCNERGYALALGSEKILHDIVHMKEAAGDYYCPCRKQRSKDTVCVCKPARNGLVDLMGSCFCNLIITQKPKGG